MVLCDGKINVKFKILKVNNYVLNLARLGISSGAICTILKKNKDFLIVIPNLRNAVSLDYRVASGVEIEYL